MCPRILFIGLAVSLAPAGCRTASEEALAAPIARIEGFGLSGNTGRIAFSFTNPNSVPLVVSSSFHTLSLGSKSIGIIDDEEPIGLPPMGTVAHTVALTPKIAQAAQGYLNKNPGQNHASVTSALQVILAADDYLTLKSTSSGPVNYP